MSRLLTLTGPLLALLWALPAQAGGVLVVRSSELAPYRAVEAAFTQALGRPVLSVGLAEPGALARLGPQVLEAELVLVLGPDAARAVVDLKPRLLLHALVPWPARAGLPASTPGVPMFVAPSRQAQALKALVPTLKTVGVVYDPQASQAMVDECGRAAAAEGFTLVRAEVGSRQEVAAAVRSLVTRAQGLWLLPDTTVLGADSFRFMVQTGMEARLPVIGFSEGMARAGAVLAVEASHAEMGREAARMATQLLAGAAPGTPALEGSLFLNARSAELLGLSLPAALKSRAVKVYE